MIRVSNLINVHENWQLFPCNECILKVFANFHVHHYADECLLKLIANFDVHHCINENAKDFCQFSCTSLKQFANFRVHQWSANSVHFTKYLDSDASS